MKQAGKPCKRANALSNKLKRILIFEKFDFEKFFFENILTFLTFLFETFLFEIIF
jgi:hypothetical protein